MRNFPGRIVVLFFIIITTGCSKCPHSKNDFADQLATLNKVKDVILQNTPEEVKRYPQEEIKKFVTKEDLRVLDALHLDNIYKIRNVLVFTFKYPYKKDWLDRKAQQNLESCNTHIIYGENVADKNDVLSYPRYAECRYKKEELDHNWTYVFQKWYCAD